ncbi:MAG: protease inhibitor I42 family protein, partial [Planctomycetes bacterium]|nr:protease inhibitor I42 family protein [Planctomycetota bacterium]
PILPPPPRPIVVHPPRPVIVTPPPAVTTTKVYTYTEPVTTTSTVVVAPLRLTGGELLLLNNLPAQAEIVLTAGQQLIFSLEENMTTGYQWVAGGSTDNAAVSVAVAHNGANVPGALGASGSASFRVTGVRPGTATLSLLYKRNWENVAAASVQLKVTVNPAAVVVTQPQVVVERPARVIPTSGMHLRDGNFYTLDMLPDECVVHLEKSGRDEVKFFLEERPGTKWRISNDKRVADVDVHNNRVRSVPGYFGNSVKCAEIELEANRRGHGFVTFELRGDNGALFKVVNCRIVVR